MKMIVMDEAVDRKNVGVSAIKDDPLLNMRPTIHCLHGTICVACEIVGKQNNTDRNHFIISQCFIPLFCEPLF